ncbi:MAG: class I SAM-dependent methyltransferase [Oscillospiraceae bacterium]|nr:class I SAM-dependent methyltransferase [Oscillospiraceae bacterium]
MAEKTASIMDFKAIIKELNKISSDYKSGSYSAMELAENIMLASDHVANVSVRDEEAQQKFSAQSTKLVQELTIFQKMSDERFQDWFNTAKHSATVGFLLVTANPDSDKSGDVELDRLLVDFFDGEGLTDVTAHYFAAARMGLTDPMKAYNMITEDFRKYPDILSKLYTGCEYEYDPDYSHDTINEVCPICGSKNSEPYYCVNQAIIKNPRFAPAKLWMKCKGCGNLYAYNFPIEQRSEINGHYTRKGGTLSPRHMLATYSEIFNNIRMYNDGRKYLEIGVGNGEMLACALEMGYEADAVEICKEDCENISGALGIDIKWCDFLDFNTSNRYDVIIMGDVLEHVSQPTKALEKAHKLLKENGILWLSTPNFNSAFTRMLQFSDPMWNQVNHFTYFSFEGLKPILDKIGFDVKRYDISKRYNGSMELILQKR